MNKAKINYAVDVLLALAFLVVAASGLVLFFFLPGGVQQGGYQEFAGIIKKTWVVIHDWSGIAFIVLALLHLILHWSWFTAMTKSLFGGKQE